ncbi:MAG: spermidine synthase, partial [Pseudomonadota bacterium]|nr:spermidine synthase [Pseudomonadota bacterium]
FLGLGTGVTAAAAAADPTLQVDVAELLPGVIEASSWFNQGSAATAAAARLHRVLADARRFVHLPGPAYDLIVADNFHPARSGSAALYTVEHFAAVRARLAPGGVFCQWLPLHQLDRRTLRHIVRSFIAVYPEGFAMLANNSLLTPVLGLVARPDAPRFDPAALRQRLASNALPQRLADFGIVDALSLLGGVVAGPAALKRLAGDAAPNTDDRPIVAFRAPFVTYAAQNAPADRLQALLGELTVAPQEIVADASDDIRWPARLAAYWRARDRFIAVGGSVRPMADVRAMLAQVQAPLLAILHTSPDFRPAHDPLLRMARALVTVDAAAAQDLMAELQRLQPARP